MPKSKRYNKKIILDLVSRIEENPVEILDLGIGCGDFGKLIKKNNSREYDITGVEIWEKYRNKKWDYYDSIIIEDIRDFVKNKKEYDVVLLVDVLEHFNEEDGRVVLEDIVSLSRELTVVATPTTNYPQGEFLGNPYEKHKYFWSHKKLEDNGFDRIAHKQVFTFSLNPMFSDYGIYSFNKK